MLGRSDAEVCTHSDRFTVLEQSNDQVIGHTLLVVREQYVATNGKVRFFHQLGQVVDCGVAEFDEVESIDKGTQPSAERVSAGLGQLGAADVQHSWSAVWLLVDLVDDAVADGHGITSGLRRPP